MVALEDSKRKASEMFPEIADKNTQQMRAYRDLPDADLFATEWVRVKLDPEEFPGYKSARVVCAECGEGINFKREVLRDGRVLCKACAGERYYRRCNAALLHHGSPAAGRIRAAASVDRARFADLT